MRINYVFTLILAAVLAFYWSLFAVLHRNQPPHYCWKPTWLILVIYQFAVFLLRFLFFVFIQVLCSVIAGFLHYFFLASFAWMCLEGVQLYVMLIEVFEAERSRVAWYYAAGYGQSCNIYCCRPNFYPVISLRLRSETTNRWCW